MPDIEKLDAVYGYSDPAYQGLTDAERIVKVIAMDSGWTVRDVVGAVLTYLSADLDWASPNVVTYINDLINQADQKRSE